MFSSVRRSRLLVAGIAAAIATTASLVVAAGPASAFSYSGTITAKAGGTYYSQSGGTVSAAVGKGSTATFTVIVKNTGSSASQFRLGYYWESIKPQVLDGTTDISDIAFDDGYYTPAIKPNATHSFTFKVKMPSNAPVWYWGDIGVGLASADNEVYLGGLFFKTNVTGTKGDQAAGDDIITSTAGQSTVVSEPGWSKTVGAQAIKPRSTTKFTLKLQNDSTVSTHIGLQLIPGSDGCANLPVTVLQGTTPVTGETISGSYSTPLLGPGKSTTLTVSVSYPTALPGCAGEFLYAEGRNIDFPDQFLGAEAVLFVNLAA